MNYIKNFSEISKNDIALVGGKGASLGELTRAGIPVPSGFVITTEVFKNFKNKEIPREIIHEILSAFDNLHVQRVAVRSSATEEDSKTSSWAGQFDSFLNISRENLMNSIKNCWKSIESERVISYAKINNILHKRLSVAVIVQKMIESEASGVMFTINPINQNKNQMIMEAGYGLGEMLVQGLITPDSYILDKSTLKIVSKNLNSQNKMLVFKNGENKEVPVPKIKKGKYILDDKNIKSLAELAVKIEVHYKSPQDIEWALEKEKFYIVQSRPITTIANHKSEDLFNKEGYLLALWFQGVSVFVTDIHNDLYSKLEALFIIDNGLFKQYFTKKAYENALNKGVTFYSDKHAFDNYKKNLTIFRDTFTKYFELNVKDKKSVSKDVVTTFFEYTRKLCGDYTQMNFESTDKAFSLQDQNSTIKENLSKVSKFKDTVRDFMNVVLFEPDGYCYKLFEILSNQFNLPISIFDNLTQREILALFKGEKPSEGIVSKRQKAFVESYNLDSFYEGKDAEPILQSFREDIIYSKLLKGQGASSGKATGKVKIIPVDYSDLSRIDKEIGKMQQGDILVAETTAPELMLACKKASAIITDMGGLMSHAAIVSREFGIPCIVGTKFATQILKDGDIIEVDANRGIVRIIKE